MKGQGYSQSQSDHTIFKYTTKGIIAISIVYVEDIVVTCIDKEELTESRSKNPQILTRHGSSKIKKKD